MIKTIKVKKKVQLDKLIRHVWDYEHFPIRIISDKGNAISFGTNGEFKSYSSVCNYDDLFEIEVEEEITEDTKFESVVINTEDFVYSIRHTSIKESRNNLPEVIEVFARIDGKLQKIWECE